MEYALWDIKWPRSTDCKYLIYFKDAAYALILQNVVELGKYYLLQ